MFPRDLVLEGIRPADITALQQLRAGNTGVDQDRMRQLEAKGWIETYGGVPLITLTGRAVLDK